MSVKFVHERFYFYLLFRRDFINAFVIYFDLEDFTNSGPVTINISVVMNKTVREKELLHVKCPITATVKLFSNFLAVKTPYPHLPYNKFCGTCFSVLVLKGKSQDWEEKAGSTTTTKECKACGR